MRCLTAFTALYTFKTTIFLLLSVLEKCWLSLWCMLQLISSFWKKEKETPHCLNVQEQHRSLANTPTHIATEILFAPSTKHTRFYSHLHTSCK